MLERFRDLVGRDVFWIAVGSIGATLALILIYHQTRVSRIIAAAEFVLKLEDRFSSAEMRQHRKTLMTSIKKRPEDYEKINESTEVLDFFEEIGLLLRKGFVPIELVWNPFSYWVLPYYLLVQRYIDWVRKRDEDVTLYAEFEYLYKRMLEFEEKKRGRRIAVTPNELQTCVDEELQL